MKIESNSASGASSSWQHSTASLRRPFLIMISLMTTWSFF